MRGAVVSVKGRRGRVLTSVVIEAFVSLSCEDNLPSGSRFAIILGLFRPVCPNLQIQGPGLFQMAPPTTPQKL